MIVDFDPERLEAYRSDLQEPDHERSMTNPPYDFSEIFT